MVYKLGENCDMQKAVEMAKKGCPVVIPTVRNGRLQVALWNMDDTIASIVKSNLDCDVESLSIAEGHLPMAIGV